jgi:hypothetical protein
MSENIIKWLKSNKVGNLKRQELTINNIGDIICYCEARGLSNIFGAYAEHAYGESIFEIGFNENSGYTYIALESVNITICSMMGRDVEYMATNFDSSEEIFFNTYQEAINFLEN